MRVGPLSRGELVATLRHLGFDGPETGGNHDYMEGRGRRVPIRNPHKGDLSRGLLLRILREAGVSREEWEAV
jgi:predicted RNA binding protein YcfA (HicA-like mRNA interferase family)